VHGIAVLSLSKDSEGNEKSQKALEPRHQSGAQAGGKATYLSLIGRTADLYRQRGRVNGDRQHQNHKTDADHCDRAADYAQPSDVWSNGGHLFGVLDSPDVWRPARRSPGATRAAWPPKPRRRRHARGVTDGRIAATAG